MDIVHLIETGDLDEIKAMVLRYPDRIRWKDHSTRNMLWWAVRCNKYDITKWLIDQKIAYDVSTSSPIVHLAVEHATDDLLNLILSVFDVESRDLDGNTVVHQCARLGKSRALLSCLSEVEKRFGRKCSSIVNAANKRRETAVDIAAFNCRPDILKILIGQFDAHVSRGLCTKLLTTADSRTIRYLVGFSLGGGYPLAMLVTSELSRLGTPFEQHERVRQAIREGIRMQDRLRQMLLDDLPAVFPNIPNPIICQIIAFVL
uniref:Uncharacterized protein n=1 Tax=Spongospora subterranea TaxID=70186 RepID=A0A0H5RBP5_9EUKA|eukprot:CRZ11448.1 hypothetical protein [Spongospora subterranea]